MGDSEAMVAEGYTISVINGKVPEGGLDTPVENGKETDNASDHGDDSGANLSPEEERLWSIVKSNSVEFNAWTALIEETERIAQDNITKVRKVYDAFLAEFPLCYGYWKKYADHEARVGAMDKVVEVYERAVQGVTYSVDMWLHYCVFAINTYGDSETIRRIFERALVYVGSDFLSSPLWDKYIEYEYMQQDWSRLARIRFTLEYWRIQFRILIDILAATGQRSSSRTFDKLISSANLATFLSYLPSFYSFKELAETRLLSELRSAEESVAAASKSTPSELGGKADEGKSQADGSTEQSPKLENAGSTDPEELKKYIGVREAMYLKAKEFESKIIGFEMAIRRPYFHVRPLNVAELENWHNYLDFIDRDGDFSKVVKLYERCVVACANYPEYWIRYVLSMEASGSVDLSDNALARATQIFVKRQPEIHLFAARLKEQKGDIAGARAAFQLVHSEISPGLLEAVIKHANMERRLGNLDDAFSLYEQVIAVEKSKGNSALLPLLYAQYSRFAYLVTRDAEKARKIVVEALENVQPSKSLVEALIHFETIHPPPRHIDYLAPLVEKAINPNAETQNIASSTEREELSLIYIEILGLFGDVKSIKKAEDQHAKVFLPRRSTSELRKRSADDFLSSDRTKSAKSHGGTPPAQPVSNVYPNAQTQWPGAQPQTWPQAQAAPAQPQQWNPTYGQQAAYGGYTAPQAPTPVPQTSAYGAYPAQTYPTQSYAHPVAAATQVQQPAGAAAPQAYYNTYY
ncbi:unnamed protein product [Cochlearia groenlandica]